MQNSLPISDIKIAKLEPMFPEVFCENKIDSKKLMAKLGNYIGFRNKCYKLNWAVKSEVFRIFHGNDELKKNTVWCFKDAGIKFETM